MKWFHTNTWLLERKNIDLNDYNAACFSVSPWKRSGCVSLTRQHFCRPPKSSDKHSWPLPMILYSTSDDLNMFCTSDQLITLRLPALVLLCSIHVIYTSSHSPILSKILFLQGLCSTSLFHRVLLIFFPKFHYPFLILPYQQCQFYFHFQQIGAICLIRPPFCTKEFWNRFQLYFLKV